MMQYEFIVAIVALVMIASIVKAALKHAAERHAVRADPDAERLRDEVKVLKDRIAVLERIATDKSVMLEREIEELRER